MSVLKVDMFKVIMYLHDIVSSISSDLGCDMVLKNEPDMDCSNKISFLRIIHFLIYFNYSITGTKGDTCYNRNSYYQPTHECQ